MPQDLYAAIMNYAKIIRNSSALSQTSKSRRCIANIAWIRPPNRWIKLNTDGVSKGHPGDAGCGGIFTGEDGHWLKGLSYQGRVILKLRF